MRRSLRISLAAVGALVIAAVVFGMMSMRVEIAFEPQQDPDARVQPVKFGHSNIYLIRGDGGYILVDTGAPGNTEKFDEVFALAGVDPQDVRSIVVTHGHLDDIGLLAHAKGITGAPVAAHQAIAAVLSEGRFEEAVAQNWMGRFMNSMTSILMATSGSGIQGVSPDIVIEDSVDLARFGVAGRIVHTPGHSPGSLSLLLESGEALIGDIVRDGGAGQIGPGMYYTDKELLVSSLRTVAEAGPETVYLSHGDRLGPGELTAAIVSLQTG